MDQQEYARYLLGLLGEGAEEGEEIDEDRFYGYFQCYMPSGKGVERTFEPLVNGDEYLNRIRPIYEMLDSREFEGDTVPGYFNGGTEELSEEKLKQLGQSLLGGLISLFSEHTQEEPDEAAEYLKCISNITILPQEEIEAYRDDQEESVYEELSDLISECTDYDEPISILREAYYSIACDYWVSYYLQWPQYEELQGSDPLAPYFELYRCGYSVSFNEQTLYIGRL